MARLGAFEFVIENVMARKCRWLNSQVANEPLFQK